MPYRKPTNWITLAIALASVLVAMFGIVTYQNTVDVRHGETLASHSYAVREETHGLFSSIKDMETGQRGFLLTGDTSYLEPYHDGLDNVERKFAKLRMLTQGDSDQQARLDSLRALVDKKREVLAEAISLRRESPTPIIADNASQIAVAARGKKIMNDIREVVTEILDEEERLLSEREKDTELLAAASERFIIAGNLLALTLFVLTGVVAHIDRRKRDRAEAQMRSSEAELAAIFNSAPDGIILFTEDLSAHLMNPAAAKMYLCDAEQSVGEPLLSFVPQRLRKAVAAEIQDFLKSSETKRFFADRVALRSDGSEFPCECTLVRMIVGGRRFLTLRFRDLSESKASQAKIREQAEMLNQVRDAILLCDMNDRILFWNRGSRLLYGLSEGQAIGLNVADILFANQRELWEAGRRFVLEQGVYSTEVSQAGKDGREIAIEHRRSLIRNENGEPAAQLIISFDITSRKMHEAKERRSQRLESIGTLAGGIAHDLNNVLTPILMGAKLIKRSDNNRERLAETIVASAERGAQMIKKLLAFAGGEQGIQERIDVRDIMLEAKEILSHTLPKTIELRVDCSNDLHAVSGDATELSQVLMNLAINARDAMPLGGSLELRATNIQVDPSQTQHSDALQAGPHVLITVADTGTGISREIIERIFDPFFTTKEQGKGTGLGLATSLGIIRTHGGDIAVSSEQGHGTTFAIYLPSAKGDTATSIHDDGAAIPAGAGEMILLVDDESMILETACVMLESAGYRVITAASGSEAVETYQRASDTISLVVLDMMMPGMDGFATKDGLRAIDPQVRIIASSGFRRPSDEGGRLADVDGFLPKPYSDERLLHLVRTVLDKKSRRESE
jgi:PAS domain S-box-containing protein